MAICYYCLGNHPSYECVRMSTDKVASNIKKSGLDIVEAVRSVETTNDGFSQQLSAIEGELFNTNQSIQELRDFLDWSHSDIVWRMEKQIYLLTGIHNMIKNPRATQSDELYKMGIDSFKRNRLKEAEKLLLEGRELNPGDYRILITLGHIYVRKDNLKKSRECFQAAVDYARTNNYKKDALLLLSRVYRCLGQKEKAMNTVRKATLIAPNYPPAQYELASCIADYLADTQ